MTNTLFDALIAPHAENQASFLECDDGLIVSFADFVRRVAQIAHVLRDEGVSPGDRIIVQAPKHFETIAIYVAAIQMGAIYLPLNTAYTETELRYFIDDADPKLVVCDTKDLHAISTICRDYCAKVMTLGADGAGTLPTTADEKEETFETVNRAPEDLAALLYTSGTTGRSKGAMLSHKNLLSNAKALNETWQITPQDRLIHALPIFHTHGLFVAINTCLLAGATVRFMERFDLDAVLSELPASTLMMGVPTFYTRLLSAPQLDSGLCKNMRLFVSGSAPLHAETHAGFFERTGHQILERYGMTETNMITSNPFEGDRIAGTVGYPLPGVEVRITDPGSGVSVSQSETGMIEVRGDNVFQGYWNMPEKTKEEMRDSGFFITGDLGSAKQDGRISIVGRQKDLIISGGYNIYPKEIEDVINDVDGVLENTVFGTPHTDFGESVLAAVILENSTEMSPDDIASEIEPKLARFKHPRRYIFLSELPRNTMGKVQKNVLRAAYSL